MVNYRLIENLPECIVFDAGDEERVKAMGKWFQENNEARMQELLAEIHRDPEFSDWQMDFTPESLKILSDWFEKHITTRAELAREDPNDPTSAIRSDGAKNVMLTELERSYTYDLSIYLGWVIIKNNPEWNWFHYINTSPNNIFWGTW